MKTSKKRQIIFIFFIILVLSMIFSLGIGGGRFQISDLLSFLRPASLLPSERTILFEIRMPRLILSVLVGAALSLSGAVLQGLFQNPLVDPYVLGISSGGAVGAIVAILSGISLGFITLPLFSFLFALATTFLVLRLGQIGHKMPLQIMLLAGVAIGFFFSALISLGMFLAGENLHQMVFWIMGGFWNSSWNKVYTFLPLFLIGLPVIFSFSRELNTFLLGEKVAESMGVDVEKTKKILLFTTSLLVAASVSVSGVIGFVGLVVPHVIRIIIGEDHRQLLPASLFLGSSVLLWADIFSRTLLHPVELPVGVLTSLMGAPFFIYLLRRKKKGW
ncbi:MAG: iron ABC transporter permease [Candidatus Atribacteria bacterium]|nr:iron ABC transporter permease [Candidatus Atribacteria bacterium]